ncbi:hypothetical protein X474_19265 [Dethiosulfatarculus sandiegensis]|uniref:Uncharacterized protein n=1 Tax=Dethiosulfatarculus sandiegensis TaxID=1429043 RepID=A0A0D2HPR8_9BACT|nr:hypothetical protein X474_19265 [Dethiosulfatarculus sandiegensis]
MAKLHFCQLASGKVQEGLWQIFFGFFKKRVFCLWYFAVLVKAV